MDLVTESLLNSFVHQYGFSSEQDPAVQFEHFVNFCAVSAEYPEEFDVEDVHVGGGDDLQLDGVAIIVNGVLVGTNEEVDDLQHVNRYISAEFVLAQAKSGPGFDGAEISNVFFGIRDLFSSNPKLPRNARLRQKEDVIKHIYTLSPNFRGGNPRLCIYYTTTGKWQDDQKLIARIDDEIGTLDDLNIFEPGIAFNPIDARKLQNLYTQTQNALSKTFAFQNRITLPATNSAREAYLGYLNVKEYLQLITDDSGNLLRGLFYDNVRDFQGNNPVNHEIDETLKSDMKRSFLLLNNGVTIVADDLSVTGDSFKLTSYQVVNGCQTSHVLYNNQNTIGDDVQVPVKLIVAPDDDVKLQVIKATNRQTVVKTEELSALTDFQKHLERYYAAVPERFRLYYERRSQQYRSTPNLEKIRIVTISIQIRAFASMFLQRASQASRYYGTLLSDIESQIFREDHHPIAYYLSSYALFLVEAMLRRHEIDNRYRPFKYHLLNAIRLVAAGPETPSMSANKFEKYCEVIRDALWDETRGPEIVGEACSCLDIAVSGNYDRDFAKSTAITQLIADAVANSH